MSGFAHPVMGIDIGKSAFVCAFPNGSPEPRNWGTYKIKYSASDWDSELQSLLTDDAVVCLEPTGINYMLPIARQVLSVPTRRLYLVNHQTTGAVRNTHISTAKSDAMDARALALIAHWTKHARPETPLAQNLLRGVKPFDPDRESAAHILRLHVNEHRRLTKTATRLKNQLDALAHSIHPELARSRETWIRAVIRYGAVSPHQIHDLVNYVTIDDPIDGRVARPYVALAQRVPRHQTTDPYTENAAIHLACALEDTDAALNDNAMLVDTIIHNPDFRAVTARWETVPGSSTLWIGALHVATHGDAQNFTPSEFKASLGVNPRTHQSGEEDASRRIRSGYRPAMDAVFMWTLHLLGNQDEHNPVRDYYRRKKDEGNVKAAGAARRKFADILSGIARHTEGKW